MTYIAPKSGENKAAFAAGRVGS